jgi:signal transduction histidine kinase
MAGVLYTATLLGQARNSANAARASLELRFENVELIERLSKEKESAQAAHQEAEQANIAKSRFFAAASHDLRQPTHAQGLFLDVLSRTNLTAQQSELIASSCAANEASAEMLNTLLDFSRIEAGVIEPQVQAFHLQPLLNKIEREFAPQADAKGLSYRSRETSLVVQSDPALLELMMRNLVSNAIRYTDHGGLLVAFRKSGDKAVLEVRDTGIGIDPSQQRDVFREFHQLGNPERDRNKGLGLGLAIVAGLSRTLKHNVSLASTQHRGSVFRVTLPIAATAFPATLTTKVLSQTKKLNMRVLVVDDDEVVRTSMLHLLRDWGCDCEVADSIEEAIALAQQNVPDVIISDYRLREQRTGAEAISTLRALVGNPLLPALLITGDTAPERLREAHASGIPLLHKPVSPNLLSSKLATILLD